VSKNNQDLENEQDGKVEFATTFQEFVENAARQALMAAMEREVNLLCGKFYDPSGGDFRRAGSEKGRGYYNGQAHGIIRPRVRERKADGTEQEADLQMYKMARSRHPLNAEIMKMAEGGMSMRGIGRLKKKGFSASTAQKVWVEESAKGVIALRNRDLSQEEFYAMMIDGVVLSRDMVVVVAIGFCRDGRKMVLDFVTGRTENYEVCLDLVGRVVKRGFKCVTENLLAVLAGADALSKAIRAYFPTAKIQRCWVHKERNLHSYLSYKDHGECSGLIERIRKAEGEDDGKAAYALLEEFLGKRNQAALQSLREGGDELLTFHCLNVPATLNLTFLSTNIIENVMLNFRRHTDRVTKWDAKTDQADRWAASALLRAEEGFRRIRNHRDLPGLLNALGGMRQALAPGSVPASPLRGAPAAQEKASTAPGAMENEALQDL